MLWQPLMKGKGQKKINLKIPTQHFVNLKCSLCALLDTGVQPDSKKGADTISIYFQKWEAKPPTPPCFFLKQPPSLVSSVSYALHHCVFQHGVMYLVGGIFSAGLKFISTASVKWSVLCFLIDFFALLSTFCHFKQGKKHKNQ